MQVVQAVSRSVIEWEEFPGRVEALESVDIRARVDGYLQKVNFRAGDQVNKGDLLFVIDPRPFQTQLDYARAELEQTKARVELAESNLSRAELLVKATAFSQEEYETRKSELRAAAAAVHSAEANVASARLNVEFTQIRAPISGHVGRELITVGNLVKGGADATVLTFLVATGSVYVYVDVDERSALKFRRAAEAGQLPNRPGLPMGSIPAELGLVDEAGFPHLGYIDYQSPRLDLATGTLTLRGVFPNPDGILSPGLFARMRLPGSAPFQAILVPDRAIVTDLAQKFVWVVTDAYQVQRREVIPGPLIDGLRVISQGLEPREKVVVAGLQRLRSGLTVKSESSPPTPSSPD